MSERMIFCLGEGKYESKGEGFQKNNRIFNVQLTPKEFDEIKKSLPIIKIPLTKWIDKKDMTAEEKENISSWKEIGGYLKKNIYEEVWAIWWKEANQEDKDKILNCKYFNGEIFTKITGIKDFSSQNLSGKTVKVELDGVQYEAVIINEI